MNGQTNQRGSGESANRRGRRRSALLAGLLAVGVAGSVASPTAAAASTDYRRATAEELGPQEFAAYEADLAATIAADHNEARVANGLAPLSWSVAIAPVADAHTEEMVSSSSIYHSNLRVLVSSRYPDHTWAGENVLSMYNVVDDATPLWLDSPGHRANLLSARATHFFVSVRCDDTGRLFSTVQFVEHASAPAAAIPTPTRDVTTTGCRDVRAVDGPTPATNSGPTSEAWAPFATPEAFVAQQYEDFLGRPADSGGLAHWSAQLRAGTLARADVTLAFLDSPEFAGRVAPLARLYRAAFQRDPSAEELAAWLEVQSDGASLADVAYAFVNSAELRARYGSLDDRALIQRLYLNVLGRPADQAGLDYWLGRRASGLSSHQMLLAFANSPEFVDDVDDEVRVLMVYTGMLERSPDAGGFVYWVAQSRSGYGLRALIEGFLASDEYRNRVS